MKRPMALILNPLVLVLIAACVLALIACTGPGEEIGSTDGYTWRRVTGPDGQNCIVLERWAGMKEAVLGLDCEWPRG